MSLQQDNKIRWIQVKALIRLKWSKLSESEVESCRNDIGLLVSSVQDSYRASHARALREVNAFRRRINAESLESVRLYLSKRVA